MFGSAEEITDWSAAANVADKPERWFEIDPATLFAALRAERGGGPTIAGYWHSHPSGDTMPSATDAKMAAADGKIWLIVSNRAATAWRAVGQDSSSGFEPIDIVEPR